VTSHPPGDLLHSHKSSNSLRSQPQHQSCADPRRAQACPDVQTGRYTICLLIKLSRLTDTYKAMIFLKRDLTFNDIKPRLLGH
jgi:hypothetical protein